MKITECKANDIIRLSPEDQIGHHYLVLKDGGKPILMNHSYNVLDLDIHRLMTIGANDVEKLCQLAIEANKQLKIMSKLTAIKWNNEVRYELHKYPNWWAILTFKIKNDVEQRNCPHTGKEKYILKIWKEIQSDKE